MKKIRCTARSRNIELQQRITHSLGNSWRYYLTENRHVNKRVNLNKRWHAWLKEKYRITLYPKRKYVHWEVRCYEHDWMLFELRWSGENP